MYWEGKGEGRREKGEGRREKRRKKREKREELKAKTDVLFSQDFVNKNENKEHKKKSGSTGWLFPP